MTRGSIAVRQAMCELCTSSVGEVIEGPGMTGVWIGGVGRWYVMEQGGRRWWTNDRSLIEQGHSFSIDPEEAPD